MLLILVWIFSSSVSAVCERKDPEESVLSGSRAGGPCRYLLESTERALGQLGAQLLGCRLGALVHDAGAALLHGGVVRQFDQELRAREHVQLAEAERAHGGRAQSVLVQDGHLSEVLLLAEQTELNARLDDLDHAAEDGERLLADLALQDHVLERREADHAHAQRQLDE